MGASRKQLIDVYNKQVRSILEFAAPVWSGGLTESESNKIAHYPRHKVNDRSREDNGYFPRHKAGDFQILELFELLI